MSDLWHSGEWRERLKQSQSVWIAASAMVALVLVLMVALNSGFANREVQAAVDRRTGLELQAGGSRFTLMPFGVQLSDVKVMTRDGSGRQILSAPTVNVPMQWRSLLTRKLKLATVTIENPVITLVVDHNGSLGWTGKGDAIDKAVAQNSAPGEPLTINVHDGSLQVLDERTGQAFKITQANAALEADRTGRMDLLGSASVAQQFLNFEAHVASLGRFSEDGTPFDLMLKAPIFETNFSGRLSVQGALSLAGTFSAESRNTAALLRWAGRSNVPGWFAVPLHMSGPIDLTGANFKSSDVVLSLGDSQFKGKFGIDLSTTVPLITGQLSTDTLRLAAPVSAAAPEPGNAAGDGFKIDLAALKSVDADLTLSAFSAAFKDVALGPTTLQVQGKEGQYDIGLAETTLLGGTASGSLHLGGASQLPGAKLNFAGTGVDLGKLMTLAGGADWLAGTGNVSLDVSAAGATSEEMISTLQGKASVQMPQGDIKGFDVATSIQQAAAALLEGWVARADAMTGLGNAEASFTLRDGIATIDQAGATIAGVDVSMTGDVDLLRRAVDVRLASAEASGGVPLAIHAVGPWGKPKLKADVAELLGIPGAEVEGKDVQKAAKKAKKLIKKIIGN